MTAEELEQVRENALIALTYIQCGMNEDRPQAEADKALVLETYGKERMYKGSFLLLNMLLATEAALLNIDVPERIRQIRTKVANGELSWEG